MHDLALRTWVEPGGDFIAEQNLRVGHQLHRQAESTHLTAGEYLDAAIANFNKAGFLERLVDARADRFGIRITHPQARRGFDRFINRQRVIRDGKLRHIADLGRCEIAVFRKVSSLPEKVAGALGIQARDGLEQTGFAASRRPDDRHEVALGNADRYAIDQRHFLAVAANGVSDILEFEHGDEWWGEITRAARCGFFRRACDACPR